MERRAQIKPTKQSAFSRMYSLAAILLVGIAQAAAQDKSSIAAAAPRNRRIIVSIPDRKLAVLEDERVLRVYTVAVGAQVSPSPTGEFKIISRVSNPTYYHPGVVIPAGKNNPLGTRWIGLDRTGYGIHGTNQPQSIGKAASHGCIRMAKADLERLFDEVRVGDPVEIRAHPDAETAAIFGSGRVTTTTAQAAVTTAERVAVGGQM
jgi:lipoprotein-anchoring transpeptidase ErfK/SrfK